MTKSQITCLACCVFIVCSIFGQDQPNILWITIEDTSPQFIGCYGNEDALTLIIDRLAEEGVRFVNAFSTGTVCSPSRSAIITGVPTYKLGTGHHRSQVPVPKSIKGFPYFLKKTGYYTSNNAKTDYNVAHEKEFIAEHGASTLNEQVQLLKSKNRIVRYWAMIGLKSRPKEHVSSFKKEIEMAMGDRYPPVAAMASAMVYNHFCNEDAEQRVKQFCKSDNMHLALLALNDILYFDEKGPFLETVREVREMPDRNYNVNAACMDYLG